jgi:hypothetical protein
MTSFGTYMRQALLWSCALLLLVQCTGLKDDQVSEVGPADGAVDGGAGVTGAGAGGDGGVQAGDGGVQAGDGGVQAGDGGVQAGDGACLGGQRACGGACIAAAACCGDAECPADATCRAGTCECPTGTHLCGQRCADDRSVESCGTSCEPCGSPESGSVACDGTQCLLSCPDGTRPCAGDCVAEAEPCAGQCPAGSHDCSGLCVDDTSVNGCGEACTPCPSVSNGTATCDGSTCGFTCAQTFRRCDDRCVAATQCCTEEDCGVNETCNASHVCECASGHKPCGGQCIPSSNCCSEADCEPGRTCVTGSCQSWCGLQTRPGNVLAADYRCVDFEAGLPGTPWSQHVAGQGQLAASTLRASSPPSSMRSHVNAETVTGTNADRGKLSWTAVGSTPVTSVSLSANIHPVTSPAVVNDTGYVDLLCIDNSATSLCLSHATMTGYVGMQIVEKRTMDGFYQGYCDVHSSVRALPVNVWTQVELRASTAGTVELFINGQAAAITLCTQRLASDTVATAVVGLHAWAQTGAAYTAHFDNVVVAVRR